MGGGRGLACSGAFEVSQGAAAEASVLKKLLLYKLSAHIRAMHKVCVFAFMLV